MRDRFHWALLLVFVAGLVTLDLLLRNEYLITENRILRRPSADTAACGSGASHVGRDCQTAWTQSAERSRASGQAGVLARYRRLIAQKLDGSRHREALVRMPRENRT